MNFLNAVPDLYDFLRGPAFVFSFTVFALGCMYRVGQFIHLTKKIRGNSIAVASPVVDDRSILFQGKSPFKKILLKIRLKLRNTIFGTNPVMGVVSLVFHVLLFVTPVFLPAHNILADQSLGVSLFTLSEPLMDKFTVLMIAIGGFFFLRRIFIPRVRILSTMRDYGILLLVMAPFLTAFAAYHQFFYYRTVLFIHMIIGEIAIMAVPFTRLGHMPFFILSRFFIRGEYNWRPANRRWQR